MKLKKPSIPARIVSYVFIPKFNTFVIPSKFEIIESPIRKHSRKPDIVRQKIIDLIGDLPRIELFAREKIEGWDCWGNEIPNTTQLLLKGESMRKGL